MNRAEFLEKWLPAAGSSLILGRAFVADLDALITAQRQEEYYEAMVTMASIADDMR